MSTILFHSRRWRRPLIASAVALVAFVTLVLGAAAVATFPYDTAIATLLALAAVWIPQTLFYATRRSRR